MNSRSSILVVDDEENGFDVIEALLFKEGYHLTYAANGSQALNHLTQTQPDVILLDVMMPDINGIELCRQIKSNSNWNHIPVIMVTALASKEDLARCLDAGADDFISKPLTGIELRSRVRSMLRIKKQHDALAATLELREDMSNMIIHDLRNPLTNIMFSAGMLLRVHLEEKERKYEVGNIISGVSQTGLGLAFCKMAVEAHGGRIFVEDNQPRGSVFTVEILQPQ